MNVEPKQSQSNQKPAITVPLLVVLLQILDSGEALREKAFQLSFKIRSAI
jgi:hypothetical protein